VFVETTACQTWHVLIEMQYITYYVCDVCLQSSEVTTQAVKPFVYQPSLSALV